MKKNNSSLKKIDEKYFINPEQYIPIGSYCRDCVFRDIDKTKPPQMNGYCHYMKKGDWDITNEAVVIDMKTGEKVSLKDMEGISMGLIWDGCKECGVKDYEKWCVDCKYSSEFQGYTCLCTLKNERVEDAQSGCNRFEP